jgi:hypothetical protein
VGEPGKFQRCTSIKTPVLTEMLLEVHFHTIIFLLPFFVLRHFFT